jgi:tryptophanyl-tRNA synthetase
VPKAFSYSEDLVKILSLDGSGKMSKSEQQMNTIYLNDDDELITRKIMKAKTDQGPSSPNSEKPEYIQGLFTLLELVSKPEIVNKFEHDFNNCQIRYGDMKKQLAQDMIQFVRPIREKAIALQNDPAQIDELLASGAAKARESAAATIKAVRKALDFNYQ